MDTFPRTRGFGPWLKGLGYGAIALAIVVGVPVGYFSLRDVQCRAARRATCTAWRQLAAYEMEHAPRRPDPPPAAPTKALSAKEIDALAHSIVNEGVEVTPEGLQELARDMCRHPDSLNLVFQKVKPSDRRAAELLDRANGALQRAESCGL